MHGAGKVKNAVLYKPYSPFLFSEHDKCFLSNVTLHKTRFKFSTGNVTSSLANVPSLCPLKIPENQRCSSVFRRYTGQGIQEWTK